MQYLKINFLFAGVILACATFPLLATESDDGPRLLSDCDLFAIRSLRWQTPWTMSSDHDIPLHSESIDKVKLIQKHLGSSLSSERAIDAPGILDLAELMTADLQDFPALEFANKATYRLENEEYDGYYGVKAQLDIVNYLHSPKLNALWTHIDLIYSELLSKRWWKMIENDGVDSAPLRGQLFLLQHTEVAKHYLKLTDFLLKQRGLKWSAFESRFMTALASEDSVNSAENHGLLPPFFKCQSFSLKTSPKSQDAVQDVLLGLSRDSKHNATVNIWYHTDLREGGDGCSNEISYQKSDDGSFCTGKTTSLGFIAFKYSQDSQDYRIARYRRDYVPSVFSSIFETRATYDSFKIITAGKELSYKVSDHKTGFESSEDSNSGDSKTIFTSLSEEKIKKTASLEFTHQFYDKYKFSPSRKFSSASARTDKGDYSLTVYDKIPSRVEPDQGSHVVHPLPDNRGFLVLQNSNLTILSVQK